jgi:polysaccharide export outer membrane protein
MRRRLPSLTAAALLALAGPSALAATTLLPPPDNVTQPSPGSGDYRIGPQDMLSISVSQVPDLSRDFQVDTGGKLLLPLVGEMQAAGRTPGQLSDDLATALKHKYMKDPQVLVTVKEAQSQKVTIDGAVTQPGVYPLVGPTTLMQAVTLAHGADPKIANAHRVAIFRTIGGERQSAFYDLAQIRSGHAVDPPVYGNDIIVVDTSGTKNFFYNFQGAFGAATSLLRPW